MKNQVCIINKIFCSWLFLLKWIYYRQYLFDLFLFLLHTGSHVSFVLCVLGEVCRFSSAAIIRFRRSVSNGTLFAYLLQRRIVWKSLAILVLEVAIVIYQKKNSSLNVVELWVTKETDESEVQSALRKYQQQGIFVCIFRSGTKDCVELTQELLRTNLT